MDHLREDGENESHTILWSAGLGHVKCATTVVAPTRTLPSQDLLLVHQFRIGAALQAHNVLPEQVSDVQPRPACCLTCAAVCLRTGTSGGAALCGCFAVATNNVAAFATSSKARAQLTRKGRRVSLLNHSVNSTFVPSRTFGAGACRVSDCKGVLRWIMRSQTKSDMWRVAGSDSRSETNQDEVIGGSGG